MEIALLPKQALRIKGKKATFVINPVDKLEGINAALYFQSITSFDSEIVKVAGAGDYEIAGVKIVGLRAEDTIIYSMQVDEIEILIGSIKALEKMQHKVKEHSMVILFADTVADASFATSLSINVAIFYGEKASEVVHSFAKENIQEMNKFQVTVDKLLPELQTILLA
ncbi:hypothetical protein BH11PAT1_BH11PAT1_1150 [soil metagenome]